VHACRFNPLGPAGVKAVMEAVKFDLPLKQLELNYCKAGERDGAHHLGQLLQFNETLEARNTFGAFGSAAKALRPNHSCLTAADSPLLSVRMQTVMPAGGVPGTHLMSRLWHTNRGKQGAAILQDVDFSGNQLRDNGAMIIGRALRQMENTQLKSLNLGMNGIEEDGAFTIANVRA
jgi:Leucine Rich repeat